MLPLLKVCFRTRNILDAVLDSAQDPNGVVAKNCRRLGYGASGICEDLVRAERQKPSAFDKREWETHLSRCPILPLLGAHVLSVSPLPTGPVIQYDPLQPGESRLQAEVHRAAALDDAVRAYVSRRGQWSAFVPVGSQGGVAPASGSDITLPSRHALGAPVGNVEDPTVASLPWDNSPELRALVASHLHGWVVHWQEEAWSAPAGHVAKALGVRDDTPAKSPVPVGHSQGSMGEQTRSSPQDVGTSGAEGPKVQVPLAFPSFDEASANSGATGMPVIRMECAIRLGRVHYAASIHVFLQPLARAVARILRDLAAQAVQDGEMEIDDVEYALPRRGWSQRRGSL